MHVHTQLRDSAVWRIVGVCVEFSCLLKARRDEVMIPRNYPSGHGSGGGDVFGLLETAS